MKRSNQSTASMAATLDLNSAMIRLWASAGLAFALTVGSIAHGSEVTPERTIFRPSMDGGQTGAVGDIIKKKKESTDEQTPSINPTQPNSQEVSRLDPKKELEFAAQFEWNQTGYLAEVRAKDGTLTLARQDTGDITAQCKPTRNDRMVTTGETKATDYNCTGFPLSGLKTKASIEYGNASGEKSYLKLGSWVDGYEMAILKVLIHRGASPVTRL